ncbi:efflux RND transporter periplasmic adaptor subunit [Sinosporangium siamense]|uniref:Peptidoglycan-binding protein n=1 Tax=Sinosporangium siamense TaxID=1367973 RepID=A0A919RG69_9ACTN|nr:peptidoglycan-binding protein [Sinosporangium siamense]GII91799.1 peptidoglycan-binding protein [Sinosporangium siamense]
MKRRKGLLLTGAAVITAGGLVAAFVTVGDGAAEEAAPKAAAPATTPIGKGDLVDTTAVDGTLTYAGEHVIKSGASGTVTALPKEGRVIRRGRALVRIDRKPQVLMYGTVPLYRTLQLGVSGGPDVKQLESNLKALGYGDGMTVDDTFTYATQQAVIDWQDAVGHTETGAVDQSQVTFLPAAVRVADLGAAVGDSVNPGQKVFTGSGTGRVVQVDLDTGDSTLARKGAAVTVELPGGKVVKGKISMVGTTAKAPAQEGGSSTIDVEIKLTGKNTGQFDQAPVRVNLRSRRVKDVLHVPIEALLALSEGGYGVEIVENGKARLVGVKTGAYGGGRVEISGQGLAEGMQVGVPAT